MEHMEKREILLCIDSRRFLSKNAYQVSGWCVDSGGLDRVRMVLLDEAGYQIPFEDYKVERSRRPDVEEALGIPCGDLLPGFTLQIRGKLPDRITLILMAGYLRREETLDLKEQRAREQNEEREKERNRREAYRRRVLANLSPEHAGENLQYLKANGPAGFQRHIRLLSEPYEDPYRNWYEGHRPTRAELHRQRRSVFPYAPLISIVVPLYETPLLFLEALITSVRRQTYAGWQLCLADGSSDDSIRDYLQDRYRREKRISYYKVTENQGISGNTNAAIAMARGEYVLFCDHDDLLAENALFEIVWALNRYHRPEVVYTDEDKIDMEGKVHFAPNFKPDFNLFWLRSNQYICHIFTVRRDLLDRVGLLRPEFDGAQDYDLVLRCCEQAEQIIHIPKVLYHWRSHHGSTAENPESKAYAFEAGRRALEAHYRRLGINARVERMENAGWYRTEFPLEAMPEVTVLASCPDSGDQREAAERAEGEFLLFAGPDAQGIGPGVIRRLAELCSLPEVGIAGGEILAPDGTVVCAGMALGLQGIVGRILAGEPADTEGYMGRNLVLQDATAVSSGCMMIRKDLFQEVGGFTPGLNGLCRDLDLCLKVQESGRTVVLDPGVKVCGGAPQERTGDRASRAYIRERWRERLRRGDPYFSWGQIRFAPSCVPGEAERKE